MTTPSAQNATSKPPPLPLRFAFEPMPEGGSPVQIVEALLKYPGRIIHELQFNWRISLSAWLLLIALIGMTAYGFIVGSFSGGAQMWIAPLKIALGNLFAMLICLPSLYIFACLSGIDARLRTVSGILFAAVALGALLLIGFAPVAWIFSQSTDSIAFMGALHLGLWAIGILLGLVLIAAMVRWLSGAGGGYMKLWGFIFHPCLSPDDDNTAANYRKIGTFLPRRKKFFLAHWIETMSGSAPAKPTGD